MKKLIITFLSLMLAFSLIACGDDSKVSSDDSGFENLFGKSAGISKSSDEIKDTAYDNIKEEKSSGGFLNFGNKDEKSQTGNLGTVTFGVDNDGDPIEWIVLEKKCDK